MISFKGAHFPKHVILYAVFFYVRYGVSYLDLKAIMEERGVKVDHTTLNRWIINYAATSTCRVSMVNGIPRSALTSKQSPIGAICAVVIARFTGEKGAIISAQNIFWTTQYPGI